MGRFFFMKLADTYGAKSVFFSPHRKHSHIVNLKNESTRVATPL
jgi:hypothetical protein